MTKFFRVMNLLTASVRILNMIGTVVMSFTKEDRNFRSGNGNSFPAGERYSGFADAVALAIKAEFGATPSTAKRVARLVSANERCVRNWLDGKNGPSGEHLIMLMRHSEMVTRSVLGLAGRCGV